MGMGFFVPFIVVATFTILNLFIGMVVSTLQERSTQEVGPSSRPLAQVSY